MREEKNSQSCWYKKVSNYLILSLSSFDLGECWIEEYSRHFLFIKILITGEMT